MLIFIEIFVIRSHKLLFLKRQADVTIYGRNTTVFGSIRITTCIFNCRLDIDVVYGNVTIIACLTHTLYPIPTKETLQRDLHTFALLIMSTDIYQIAHVLDLFAESSNLTHFASNVSGGNIHKKCHPNQLVRGMHRRVCDLW